MITAELQKGWAKSLLEAAGSAPAPWLEELRSSAGALIDGLPLVNRKQEAWRYTNVEPLLKESFQPVVERPDRYSGEVPEAITPHRLVFVDGWFMPGLSDTALLPEEVTCGSLNDAIAAGDERVKNRLGSVADPGEHLFTALNTALVNDGLFLHIPAGVKLESPVELFWLNSGGETPLLAQPRNLVILEPGAEAVLVEHHLPGAGERYLHNGLTEIVLDPGAKLDHYRVQDESEQAWHFSRIVLDQGSDSRYHGITLAFGGRLARTEYNGLFTAEGARCTLRGLYTVGDDQLQDFHLDVRHDVPHCSSREQFKGLLYGKGRAVFDGRILVAKDAQKSDAELTNDNLLLTRNAEVDTKPQLEIYADDVKASHGTTVGQLEANQVFYLRARGIDEQKAVHMLCEGFAAEIIEHIHLETLQEQALARLRQTLGNL